MVNRAMGVERLSCIYCPTTGDRALFSQEHVIPQAFGTFGSITPTLTDCVCANCNSFFGKSLELFFNRGSLEALDRYKQGLKPLVEVSDLRRDRVTFTLAEGPFKGARLELVAPESGYEPLIDLVTQAGFVRRDSGEREFFTLSELQKMSTFDKGDYELTDKAGILFCVRSDDGERDLTAALGKLGIKFSKKSDFPNVIPTSGKVFVETTGKIDRTTQRTIAKIGFNYMAWQLGAAYALRSDFDVIRSFIRNGEVPPSRVVVPSSKPLLAQDTVHLRQTTGHLVNLETQSGWRQLVAGVSLFNGITYSVLLAPRLSGVLRRVSSGHHFDFRNKKVDRLVGVPKEIQVVRRIARVRRA